MKILWVSASAIGPASRILGQPYLGSSGVWIQTIYEELKESADVEMYFLCFSKKTPKRIIVHNKSEEGHAYCLNMPKISLGRKAPEYLKCNVEKVIRSVQPDIIQIWGTETCVQNIVANVAPEIPKVVFLQGLIGIHDRYHNANLKKIGLSYHRSFHEYIRCSLHDHLFHRQVKYEAEEIVNCKNVIIDNDFSAAYCKSLSGKIQTLFYPLNPAKVFQQYTWTLSNCEPHTVFTVYGASQDKGLHQLLRAISIVKKSIPDIRVYIPGRFHIEEGSTHLSDDHLTSYEKLLSKIIKAGDIEDNVFFCGQLSQEQMAERLIKANIFVNPSVMEVHAGSLREAMLVGTPSISTYCGSIGEFVIEGKNGLLYRYEEYEVLAYKIIELLMNSSICNTISYNARNAILQSQDIEDNSLYDIYLQIAERK